MLKVYISLVLVLLVGTVFSLQTSSPLATCKPLAKGKCKACKNCKYCKHCSKDGGKCSVCAKERAQRLQGPAKKS